LPARRVPRRRGGAFLGGPVVGRAGAAEGSVVALEHALLLGVKAEPVGVAHKRVDTAEQRRIGVDPVPVARELRRNLALDRKQCIVGVGAGEDVEHIANALERAPAQFHGRDRVGEGRRLGGRGNGGNLGLMLGQRPRISGAKMLRRNAIERGHAVRGRPIGEERISGGRIVAGRR
jgi:hypothetical protein